MKYILKIKSISAGVLITILLLQGVSYGTAHFFESTVYAQEESEFLLYENYQL